MLAGAPNAGKSTLLNRISGGSLSIVSPKPQTTRQNLIAIKNSPGSQLALVDTPGYLDPRYKLQETMLSSIRRALHEEADVVCFVAEPNPPGKTERALAGLVAQLGVPAVLAINKIDSVSRVRAEAARIEYGKLLPGCASIHMISASRGTGVEALTAALSRLLPEHEPYFPEGQWTDKWERFFAAEFVREQLLRLYEKEIPYACAAQTETFQENPGGEGYVRVVIHVERETQKPIIIGKGGGAIKKVREGAQKRLEEFLGRKLRLELFVKVSPGWRSDTAMIKEFGYHEG